MRADEVKTGKLIFLCWFALGLKVLPHLLLPLHFRGLGFEKMQHYKLVWQELTRCWCILMPLHQWTLALVVLVGFRVFQHWKAKGWSLHLLKGAAMVLPLLLALRIAAYEFNAFSFFIEDMDPFKKRISSVELLRPLDAGEDQAPHPTSGDHSKSAPDDVSGQGVE